MPNLTPCEQKYFQLLQSGDLLKLFPQLSGIISEDWDKWIVIYKEFN